MLIQYTIYTQLLILCYNTQFWLRYAHTARICWRNQNQIDLENFSHQYAGPDAGEVWIGHQTYAGAGDAGAGEVWIGLWTDLRFGSWTRRLVLNWIKDLWFDCKNKLFVNVKTVIVTVYHTVFAELVISIRDVTTYVSQCNERITRAPPESG